MEDLAILFTGTVLPIIMASICFILFIITILKREAEETMTGMTERYTQQKCDKIIEEHLKIQCLIRNELIISNPLDDLKKAAVKLVDTNINLKTVIWSSTVKVVTAESTIN